MKKLQKNKKGFTLVELLAVIVILALIMSIAVVSMGGIMQSARESTFRQSAAQIIEGVRTQLTANFETVKKGNAFFTDSGTGAGVTYYFTEAILDKKVDSPMGGSYRFLTSTSGYEAVGSSASGVYRKTNTSNTATYGKGFDKDTTCSASSNSFVSVKYTGGNFVYRICLATTTQYFFNNVTETSLLDNTAVVSG